MCDKRFKILKGHKDIRHKDDYTRRSSLSAKFPSTSVTHMAVHDYIFHHRLLKFRETIFLPCQKLSPVVEPKSDISIMDAETSLEPPTKKARGRPRRPADGSTSEEVTYLFSIMPKATH
jgi:hypothetical protein